MRVATFNLQNLRLRTTDDEPVLDGAADRDDPGGDRPAALARADRMETAKVIASAKADVVAMQEVFDLAALDFFHDRFLLKSGSPAFPHRYCFRGNDGQGLNVAAMCRRPPIRVRSHADLTGKDLGIEDIPGALRTRPIFRRDCLELEFDKVTLFICHFKAPHPDVERALVVREAEARAVRKIVESRFPDPQQARWIILGDLNEPARNVASSSSALRYLAPGFAVDLLDRLIPGTDWTFEVPYTHLHSRPDRILVSPRLAEEYPEVRPRIIRSGMADRALVTANAEAPRASDHALVYADFPGL